MPTTVVKFGGSSLASASQIRKAAAIIRADSARRFVVVSAPGKRDAQDNKVTDLLYICHAHIRYKVGFDDIWENIAGRYREIAKTCGLSMENVESMLSEVRTGMTRSSTVDEIVSRGEYMNAYSWASTTEAFLDRMQRRM